MTVRPDLADWILLIRAEYSESPGLQLTMAEAQRLWNLDRSRCETILDVLEAENFLRRTRAGRYVRVNAET